MHRAYGFCQGVLLGISGSPQDTKLESLHDSRGAVDSPRPCGGAQPAHSQFQIIELSHFFCLDTEIIKGLFLRGVTEGFHEKRDRFSPFVLPKAPSLTHGVTTEITLEAHRGAPSLDHPGYGRHG